MNAALLGTADPDVEPYAHLNPAVQPCLAHIDRDPQFRDLIQQFLAKFEVYRAQTDEIIDMVGEYNVFAVPEADRWTLRIGSVLKGQRHTDVLAALAQLRQVGGQGARLAPPDRFILLNGLAVYRLINALAIQTGVGRLIDIRLDHEQLEAISTVRFAHE